VGRLEKELLDKFDIDEDVYLLEVSIKDMIKEAVLEKKFRAVPRFPSIMRDISLVCGKDLTAESLLNAMREASSDIVKGITLVDKYAGKQIPEDSQGLLYRIEYRDDSRTLTDKAVEEIHSKIKGNLSSKLGVSFR